ncbi:MAG: vanadium-dependent haloperoxidase [Saprospiraceae bacterium]|nr:vanadium-dependent haloperoxidase [Saprospiraceae bacterium]
MRNIFGLFVILALFASCKRDNVNTSVFGTADLNKLNRKLLEIAMEDGFPPPIASRVYVYPHIGNYLVLEQFYKDSLPALMPKLKGLGDLSGLNKENVNPELASLLTFTKIGKKVIFSEFYMGDARDSLLLEAKKRGLSENVIQASDVYSDSISAVLQRWMAKDNYVNTRTMDRYTSVKQPGRWKETPPDYIQALEPHWGKIRTILIDSASVYNASKLPEYSTQKNSEFYKMALEVYNESKNLDSTKIATAWFWDDNPNTTDHRGHSVAIIHKISPPGHWLNIIHQISEKENFSFLKTSKAYTLSAIAMFDGIISCWYQKYKTDLVRPISYIQENIDVNWIPLIQTPPFPEYTSGHSVLSAAAATVLNQVVSENYKFHDDTPIMFGALPRDFNSFDEAAWEVSLSRYYGGIHYMQGIKEGNTQGKFIGNLVLSKLK